jgi:8-oxo-dGTP pyrophosphatase MutT (NUDIX family)
MSAETPSFRVQLLDRGWRVGLRAAYWTLRLWWFVRRPTLESAFVAVWRQNELLLIRNSYRCGVTIPSGGIDAGETPRAAARRELEEEVGLSVPVDALAPSCEVVMPFECKLDHGHFFELQVGPSDPCSIEIDRREVVWAEFCHEDRLDQQPLSPQVRAYLARRREEPIL